MLPPTAGFEADVIERLIGHFAGQGYARVKAPLVEFEEGLLSGAGAAMSGHIFRLMDPVSQHMMGVRADITPQIARIASTRLKNEPRPLRLSYSGEVLRIRGTQLQPERQFAQVGVELIGRETAAADAEIIVMAAEALTALEVTGFSIDLTIPTLVPALFDALGVAQDHRDQLRAALDRKDADVVQRMDDLADGLFSRLLSATGKAEQCIASLLELDLPPMAAAERDRVADVLRHVRAAAPTVELTLDPVENRGFEYHTGVSFTIFPTGARGELGAGGRYVSSVNGTVEAATGFTLFLDTILRVMPEPEPGRAIFLPLDIDADAARKLRGEGWITIRGLDAADDPAVEARRQGCSHVFEAGEIREVGEE
ncbi:MAG: ATP phosphoribosyltransferase regulatory subunit [Pseudomonadota bacterium]|nr:ATP phosphoribosyltransferase regulatory subunit [Pseudomonadota bacterium]